MDTLAVLIRLVDKKLDELRHNLNVYLDKRDQLEQQNSALAEQLELEKRRAVEHVETAYTFPYFAASSNQKQEQNRNFIAKLEEQAEKIREEMQDAFSEKKRYELLQKARAEREAKREADRETAMLNELAIQGFRRKQQEDSTT